MTNLSLKIANKDDRVSIVHLLTEMHKESGMGSLNINKVLNAIELCLSKGVILSIEMDKEIVAVMGLRPSTLWWTDNEMLMDQFTYVQPKARKTKAIFKLVKEAKTIAKEMKMPMLLANFGFKNEERISKMYRRFGKPLGTTIITGDTSSFLWNK